MHVEVLFSLFQHGGSTPPTSTILRQDYGWQAVRLVSSSFGEGWQAVRLVSSSFGEGWCPP